MCKYGFCDFADKGNKTKAGKYICIKKMFNQKCIMENNNGKNWKQNKSK